MSPVRFLLVIISFLIVGSIGFAQAPSRSLVRKASQVQSLVATHEAYMTPAQKERVYGMLLSIEETILGRRPAPFTCSQSPNEVMQSTFVKVKGFAYATAGLNYNDSAATQWAQQWINRYPCERADSYLAELAVIRNFAYATAGLNYNSQQAAEYALSKVDSQCSRGVDPLPEFTQLYKFAYSTSGLNMNDRDAKNYAQTRIEPKYFSCPQE
jgi:hypothetical protein